MTRRIAALILLQPELDKNYEAVKADTWPWPRAQALAGAAVVGHFIGSQRSRTG